MPFQISKILLPSFVGISVYLTINKLFPEKVENWEKDSDSIKGFQGGSARRRLLKQITERILKDRALKIAILSVFATAGIQHFQSEIEALLMDDVFTTLCGGVVEDPELKVVCDIVQDHDLSLHAKSIKALIVSNNLSQEQKISLLKIKLDFIINGECAGKKRFLVMILIGAILAFSLSGLGGGLGGLALLLEAFYRLFQQGRISEALYQQIVKALAKR